MIKLPAREDGQWTVQYANDKSPDLIATRNVTFDREGYIRLSKPSIALFNYDDNNDLGLPILFGRRGEGHYKIATTYKIFDMYLQNGGNQFAEDTKANVPTGEGVTSTDTGATVFNENLVFTEIADVHTYDFGNGTWTDQAVTLNSSTNHYPVNFVSQNNVAIADTNNTIKQFNAAYASGGDTLTVPADFRITGFAYNRGYLGIAGTDSRSRGDGYAFIWDGNTAGANQSYPLNATGAATVIPYKDTFVWSTGNGQLLAWTGSGLAELANFPLYYTSGATYYSPSGSTAHPSSWLVDGSLILLNTDSQLTSIDEYQQAYLYNQPAGIWCYDPAIGLYHRHATTARRVQHEYLKTADVNTTTDEITVSSAPDTGTPVNYCGGGDTALGGLKNGTTYYTIKVDATTIKLAETYADALAGTAVDITTAPSGNIETIATTAVDTATDQLTWTTAPNFYSVLYYDAQGGTAIGGLTSGETYMAYKIDATTIELRTSFERAVSTGLAIDLTGTGNDSQTFEVVTHNLTFIPKSDFGQSYTADAQGCIDNVGLKQNTTGGNYVKDYLFGVVAADVSTTEKTAVGCLLENTENRGYVITSNLRSQQLQEDWQKIFIKHSKLVGDLDEIHIKYRTTIEQPVVKLNYVDAVYGGAITWTDSDTFTTTDTQYANVQAGDEVEVVQGAGSGYLLHVASISETGGTYTVNLDESVKNISASDTGRAIVSRWTKLTTLDSGTITNEDGYSEIAVGVKSKSIQFKIELRGEDVEIEEILVAHTLHKPVA